MKVYKDEILSAEINEKLQDFSKIELCDDQKKKIAEFTRKLQTKINNNLFKHNIISILVFSFFILCEVFVFWATLPKNYSSLLLTAAIFVHAFVSYSAITYSMHEGAGHQMLFLGKTRFIKVLNYLGVNFCRLFFADPLNYGPVHKKHHSELGTINDGAFTHYVLPKRIAVSFLPLAAIIPFNDFKIHAPDNLTKSSLVSTLIGLVFHILILSPLLINAQYGTAVLFILLSTWISFSLDRLREITEHQLLPRNKYNGARNFGLSPWGLIVGGGPWGQACHLSHHLSPGLPWYGQISLHYQLKKIFNKDQKEMLLKDKWDDFPRLLINIMKKNIAIAEILKKGSVNVS